MLGVRGSLFVLAAVFGLSAPALAASSRTITFEDRIAAQRAIEEVYWRHRIWPKENPGPKPPLDAVMPEGALRAKVDDSLRKSNALESIWQRPLTGAQLQDELDRIARSTRDAALLREIFAALGNDPELIAETLVREKLADRLVRGWYAADDRVHGDGERSFDAWWGAERASISSMTATPGTFSLPKVSETEAPCADDSWRELTGRVPAARSQHLAAWTGAEMVIWGGSGLNTGGRYDPSTDTWLPTSLAEGVPNTNHASMIWTGTELLLWGAGDGPSYAHTGRRYDPAADKWSKISIGANAPLGRSRYAVVWTGTEMIVWGGTDGASTYLATGARYDPVLDRWSPTSPDGAPVARQGPVAIWTGTEMIVWGGRTSTTALTNTGARYDPSNDRWTPTSTTNAPTGREGFTSVWTGTQMIVWGGINTNVVNTGGRYDPVLDRWTPTSTSSLSARQRHTAVWTGSEMIVWGGSASSNATTGLGNGARYDPVSELWQPIALPPLEARRFHTAVWTGTEMIIWGGALGSSSTLLNDGARYDPRSNSWVPTSLSILAPTARQQHTAVWTGAEMIVWGGDDKTTAKANSGAVYEPTTDTWRVMSTTLGPSARYDQTAIWTGMEMLVWGGTQGTSILIDSGARYNPTNDTWRTMSTGPSARSGHTAVWTGTEMIVWGGSDVGTGGRYRPSTDAWTPTATDGAPLGRHAHTAVWTGTQMIVWGGVVGTASPRNDGGCYDPSTNSWKSTAITAATPSARGQHSAVWTGTEMIVWGGATSTSTSTTFFGDGGRYDLAADAWKPIVAGAGAPEARRLHLAAWTGSGMIVWGGQRQQTPQDVATGARYEPASDTWKSLSDGAHLPDPRRSSTAVWTGSEMIVWGGGLDVQALSSGSAYCARPGGGLCFPDVDGDGYGDSGLPLVSCPDPPPPGYTTTGGDCDDADARAHPGAAEVCNGIDDDCDTFVDDYSGVINDHDGIPDACDNCPTVSNLSQSDRDHDGQGDACDVDDGEIFLRGEADKSVQWDPEAGFDGFNLYVGDLSILRSTGVYTQRPDSNPLAQQFCNNPFTYVVNEHMPFPGQGSFELVTGVHNGVESSLGDSSFGPRPNTSPCP